MVKKSREIFLNCLQNNWGHYVERFQALPPQDQHSFLEKQGYASFSGLLAHVVAWWQDGALVIERMRADPSLPLPDYDVDAFNAQAVQSFGGLSEAQAVERYESRRRAMADLVAALPQGELDQENINTRLHYEILQHWLEHELNESQVLHPRPSL